MQVKDILSQVMVSYNLQLKNKHESIYMIETIPKYIFPTFKEVKRKNASPIMIFSAPGAVGKTTFAKFFANKKNGYYWDLSRIKLGLNTFIGTLADCFGHENLATVLQKLERGEITFFFDGFDEAEMFSGWDGVVDFVSEIYKYVKKSESPNIIFFSRTETVDLITLALEDVANSDPYSLYEIDYFDEIGATQFVKMVLDENGDTNYTKHPQPFVGALNEIFKTISLGLNIPLDDIWISSEARSFIGYSPVLQTIGRFLVDQNYTEVSNEFKETDFSTGLKVIAKFIDSLLLREQAKVVDGIKQNTKTNPDFDDWGAVYSPEIQLECLVHYFANDCDIVSIIGLIKCPSWLENIYLDAVSRFLPNHPFIRKGEFASPSFKDYTLSNCLAKGTSSKESFALINKSSSSLSPLFAYYYHEKTSGNCNGPIVGLIYDSLSSKMKFGDSQLLTVTKSKNDATYSIDITLLGSGDSNFSNINFECLITEELPLTFDKRLHNAIIYIDSSIRFGNQSESIELRDVEVCSNKISIQSKEFIANCYEGSNITLLANEIDQNLGVLKVSKIGDGDFAVKWPESQRYPWSQFHNENIKPLSIDDNELMAKVYALKIILTPFRKHNKGVFAKQYEYIENIIIKDNPIKRGVFNKMLENGILLKNSSSNIYELNDGNLESNGINWSDLRSLTLNERLIRFLN